MKARLLKNVRKRFEIIHMPKGFTAHGERYAYNLYKLIDNTNEFRVKYAQLVVGNKATEGIFTDDRFNTEKECIDFLKSHIILILRSEGNIGNKDKRGKQLHKKVWYNTNK